jgi:hypothetical protein
VVVDEGLHVELPVLRVLHLVEQEDRGLSLGEDVFTVDPKEVGEAGEFQEGVVQADVDHADRRGSPRQQHLDDLLQYRGLAHTSRAAEKDGPLELRILQ